MNRMFSGINVRTDKSYIPNQDDKSSINTKRMRYANMVEHSQKYIITNYRAPNISGNTVIPDNPILNGAVYITGNLNVYDNYDIDRYYQGPVTGYLNVLRDITSISGDVHTNDIYISGNIFFVNSEFGFKSNVFSPSLVSYTQRTNAIYSYESVPFQISAFGLNILSQIWNSNQDEAALSTSLDKPFYNFTFNGYCTDMLWNGITWVATGCGDMGSIASSLDGKHWTMTEKYTIFNIGNSYPTIPYGGAYAVEWNGTYWVVGGYGTSYSLAYSNISAINWKPCETNPFINGYCSCIKWNGRIWLAGGNGNNPRASMAYSYDGITWTAMDGPDSTKYPVKIFPDGCNFITWNGLYWLAGGNSNKIAYSLNGFTWNLYTIPEMSIIRNVGWSGTQNKWVLTGDSNPSNNQNMMYSYDGKTWILANGSILLDKGYSVKWVQRFGYWLATGKYFTYTNTPIIKSYNGIDWIPSGSTTNLNPCYGLSSTDDHSGYLFNQGSADFLGEQVTIANSLYINGNISNTGINTGSLVIQGGVSNTGNGYIGGSQYIQNNLIIAGNQDSSGLSTGAFIVQNGGASIKGNLFLGGNLITNGQFSIIGNIESTTGSIVANNYLIASRIYSIATTDTGLDISSNAIIAGYLTLLNSTSIQGNLYVNMDISTNGNLYVTGKTYVYNDVFIQGSITNTSDISSNGNLYIGKNSTILLDEIVKGNITVNKDISIDGNAKIGGNLQIGGTFVTVNPYNVVNTQDSTSTNTGALIVAGGLGIAKSVVIGNTVTIKAGIESTSTGTGSLLVNGGVGIQNNLFVGGTVNIKSGFNLLSTSESTSTDTGSLSLYGGLGVAKSIYVGINSTVLGTSTVYDNFYEKKNVDICGNLLVGGSSGLSITTGGASISGPVNIVNGLNSLLVTGVSINDVLPNTLYATIDASFGKNIIVNSTQESSSTSTGSIMTYGGIGISKSAFIGNTLNVLSTANSISTSTGAVMVSGGVGISKDVNIGGNLYLNQYLIQNLPNRHTYLGTSVSPFTFNNGSTDNTIVGYNSGTYVSNGGNYNTFLGSGTNFDIANGQYNRSTAIGAGATITGSNQVVLGTPVESVIIPGKVSGQDSTSTSTGALVVSGGAGISGNIFCGNSMTIYGTTDATNTGTGSLIVSNGGASIKKNLYVGNQVYIQSNQADNALNVIGGINIGGNTTIIGNTGVTNGIFSISNTTDSYSTDNGSCIISGGVGIGKSINIGSGIIGYSYANQEDWDPSANLIPTIGALVLANGGAAIAGTVNVGRYLNVGKNAMVNQNLSVSRNLFVGTKGGSIYLYSDYENQSYITIRGINGEPVDILQINSNVDISYNLTVDQDTFINSNLYLKNTFFDANNFYSDVTYHNGIVKVATNIDSLTPYSGSLIIQGGLGVSNNAYIANEMNSGTVETNCVGIQYNTNNNTNTVIVFSDQSFNYYLNDRYTTSSHPTNISLTLNRNIDYLTSQTAVGSPLISGGGITYNGYIWIGVFNGYQSGSVTTRIYYSYDGLTWQATTNDSADFRPNTGYGRLYWNGVAWNSTMWVACGYPIDTINSIKYSYNGYTWYNIVNLDDNNSSTDNAVPGFYGHDVAWNGNMWVCVGRNSTTSVATYSYNGIKWYAGTFADVSGETGSSLDSVSSANGRIWVACGTKIVYYSYNGITWKTAFNNNSYNFHSVSWSGSQWMCLGTDISNNKTPILYTSPDGISWSVLLTNLFTLGNYRYFKVLWNPASNEWYMSSTNALSFASPSNPGVWTEFTNIHSTETRYPAMNFATSNIGTLQVCGTTYGNDATFTGKVTVVEPTDSASTGTGAFVVSGGVGIGGNLYVGGNTVIKTLTSGTVYSDANGRLSNVPSDIRYKDQVEYLSRKYGLDAVLLMNPISYYWKDTERFGKQKEIGFIAQDMQYVVPEVVHPIQSDQENSEDPLLSLDYAKLTPVLVKAIQQLEERVCELEEKIRKMEQ